MYRISWLPNEILFSKEGIFFHALSCSVYIGPMSIQSPPIDFVLNDRVLRVIAFDI
jgi:hypothetical protein